MLNVVEMLKHRRPAWSRTEEEFITRYIDPVAGMKADDYGNRILVHDRARVMIACHTDTVHRMAGRQRVAVTGSTVALDAAEYKSNCLGADDTAGIYAALRMIDAGVKATFVFHRAEEIGGCGSDWLARTHPEWLKRFDICLSLDRRGTADIITSQAYGNCASEQFALSLAGQLGMGHRAASGIFTDSANYGHLIPECSNISIGYAKEHTYEESLDLDYLERVITALTQVDWADISVARIPGGFGFGEMEDDGDEYEWPDDWPDELGDDEMINKAEQRWKR